MRLFEIAQDITKPVVVKHEECGSYILLPDCGLLTIEWKRLSTEENSKVRYGNADWKRVGKFDYVIDWEY